MQRVGGPCRIDLVVGTRPNIIKLSSLANVLRAQAWCEARIVFIAQHTSRELSGDVFEDLGMEASRITVIPLSHSGYGSRLGEVISAYSLELAANRPDLVVVFGDVDVTLGAALAAKRAGIALAHIEAGLRSGDREMPEEMNRILVDSITDLFYAPSEDAFNNLVFGEAKNPRQVHFAGNIMIDALVSTVDESLQRRLETEYGIRRGQFALATFHRPSNVDDGDSLAVVVDLLEDLAARLPLLLPLHPRTELALQRHGLRCRLAGNDRVRDVPAIRYGAFVNLVAMSRLVLTDSGGTQEEASFLGVPCLTYRDTTERPATIRLGTNTLVNRYDVGDAIESALRAGSHAHEVRLPIPLWDGKTAYRIAASLCLWWSGRA